MKPVHCRFSNKQSQESLRGNRSLSTNRFTRNTHLRVDHPFERSVRGRSEKKLYWHWISFWVYIRRTQRRKQERECSKIRLPLTKKISSRKCYCGEIFEHRFVLDLMCTKGGKMKKIVTLDDGSFLLEERNLEKEKIMKVMDDRIWLLLFIMLCSY